MSAVLLDSRGGDQLSFDLEAIPLNNFEWKDNDGLALLEGKLMQLSLLCDQRSSKHEREELLDWVATPLVKPHLAVKVNPFSFQCCCYASGVDPEEMQESILMMFSPVRLARLLGGIS